MGEKIKKGKHRGNLVCQDNIPKLVISNAYLAQIHFQSREILLGFREKKLGLLEPRRPFLERLFPFHQFSKAFLKD